MVLWGTKGKAYLCGRVLSWDGRTLKKPYIHSGNGLSISFFHDVYPREVPTCITFPDI